MTILTNSTNPMRLPLQQAAEWRALGPGVARRPEGAPAAGYVRPSIAGRGHKACPGFNRTQTAQAHLHALRDPWDTTGHF
jgi:hypothetical protein